ncbi:MAG: ABC transporter ATP-binding protein, partial [Gammaproteobacteria bacterium]
VLAVVLLALLALAGLFSAVQVYLMELFERRFFSRIVSEVTLRLVYADPVHMESINRDELVNRYFDIMTVQKSLPPLLTGGLATALQTAVGIAVTSFYHPLFILFNVVVVLLAYLVFRIFDRGAARSSVDLSTTKYDAANWLETLSRSNSFFKSRRTIDFAFARTEAVRAAYIRHHRRHFHFRFAQIVGFLLLYALASATLLGFGGWLVIIGQLTIGQLVAAELILTAIFYGLTRIGYYLELYYDLYAAMNKLLHLYVLPAESPHEDRIDDDWEPTIRFDGVSCALPSGRFDITLELPARSLTLMATRSSTQVKAITDLLLGNRRPDDGRVLLGPHEVDDFNLHHLRDLVLVVDATPLPECSIAEFLDIAAPGITRARMRALLEIVGLNAEMGGVDGLLDEPLTPYGHPLSVAGVIKLKTAFALAARPRLLVLTPTFDMLSQEARMATLTHLSQERAMTVLCFSHRRDLPLFDHYIMCDFDRQVGLDDIEALFHASDREPDSRRAGHGGAASEPSP